MLVVDELSYGTSVMHSLIAASSDNFTNRIW